MSIFRFSILVALSALSMYISFAVTQPTTRHSGIEIVHRQQPGTTT
jgi:hypothetical protein